MTRCNLHLKSLKSRRGKDKNLPRVLVLDRRYVVVKNADYQPESCDVACGLVHVGPPISMSARAFRLQPGSEKNLVVA